MLVVPEVLHAVCEVSYPAIVAEAITYEVDMIRKTLTKQLVRCSDESLRWELQTALLYVTLRPFEYTICRTVSLNIYLPFTFISLCATYVLVVLQLSHFSVHF
ncbi:hypothetical protein PYW07_008882 [Mythimna separata]|uniref:Uncharacterized protein n=1 Tax=Mythimna separata TaxID=271217 RepID=A0AAD7YBD4_MYTSE|nr:hypothetical protein PYW07_008882 [Mythimna separata]